MTTKKDFNKETMPEYIEREAMWKEYQKFPIHFISHGVVVDAYRVQEAIKTLPTADVVEVKHGEWKQCFEDWRKQIEGDECSACGFQHYGTSISNYNYCPNCGAKMDKKEGVEG